MSRQSAAGDDGISGALQETLASVGSEDLRAGHGGAETPALSGACRGYAAGGVSLVAPASVVSQPWRGVPVGTEWRVRWGAA